MFTIRVRGVPKEATIDDISRAFGTSKVYLARTESSEDSSQTATVGLPDKKTAQKILKLEAFTIRGEKVLVDSGSSGLTVLASGNNPVIDIIAVHGLNGHAFRTWTSGDAIWLRDFLPTQLPDARIMTYGYGSNLFSSGAVGTITDFSNQLLVSIDEKRTEGEKKRPIIFICHSLGGIVVKRALNLSRIEKQHRIISDVTVGIIFMATPHQGSATAKYGALIGLVAKASNMRDDLVKDLRDNSGRLSDIAAEFRQHHESIQFGTFFERRKTRIGLFINQVIVDKHSAVLNLSHEQQIALDRDHSGICKFQHRESEEYKLVYKQIQRMAENASANVESRLQPKVPRPQNTFLVPYPRNEAFVGRKKIIDELEKMLSSNTTNHLRMALYGLGGTGKTQIAIEYSYQCKERHSVFWVHASDYIRFEQDYRKIAKIAKIPGHDDKDEEILASTKNWLESPESNDWLLILDNADDLLVFFPSDASNSIYDTNAEKLWRYIPRGSKGKIIITTRDRNVASKLADRKFLRMDKMDPEEGEELLIGKNTKLDSDEDQQALPGLLEALEHLPLAIAHAAAFMSENYESPRPAQYLKLLTENRVQLLSKGFIDIRRPSEVPEAVLTTWHITFIHVQKQCPLAANLLKLIAFLDRRRIPKALLRSSKLEGIENLVQFDSAIGKLTAFSLIKVGSDQETYEVHRLVHLATKEFLGTGLEEREWAGKALELLSREFPLDGDYSSWVNTCAVYYPHAEAVIGYLEDGTNQTSFELDHITSISQKLGRYLHHIRRDMDAEKHSRRALSGREIMSGLEHLDTLTALGDLALVLKVRGNNVEAERMNLRVVEGQMKILGLEHPDTLTTLSNLAGVFWAQGKYSEAEGINRRVLEGRAKVLGLEHSDTLTTLSNLAAVLRDQGKYTEAEEINWQVLEGKKKLQGLEHPSTLKILNNLASVLRDQGKYSEAEEMNRRIIDIKEKVLGLEHPGTLSTLSNLAIVLKDQGNYHGAEQVNWRVLGGREKILGPEHPETLKALNNLAIVLQDQGNQKEAEQINRRVLERREKVLGPEHPDTLTTLSNLAYVLQHQGKYSEAEDVSRRALEGRQKALGLEHPDTLKSLIRLAFVLEDQGKYSEAEQVKLRVIEREEKTLGLEHPKTLATLENLAALLWRQGKYSEAEDVGWRVLEGREKVLGPEHPDTLKIFNNLAIALRAQGKYSEAEDIGLALNLRRQTLAMVTQSEVVNSSRNELLITSGNHEDDDFEILDSTQIVSSSRELETQLST